LKGQSIQSRTYRLPDGDVNVGTCEQAPDTVQRDDAMNRQDFRDMTDRERSLIRVLLSAAFPGRDELAEQIETAHVRDLDEDGSFEFYVRSGRCPAPVKYVVPVEGEYEDPDGVIVHVLLHMDTSP